MCNNLKLTFGQLMANKALSETSTTMKTKFPCGLPSQSKVEVRLDFIGQLLQLSYLQGVRACVTDVEDLVSVNGEIQKILNNL